MPGLTRKKRIAMRGKHAPKPGELPSFIVRSLHAGLPARFARQPDDEDHCVDMLLDEAEEENGHTRPQPPPQQQQPQRPRSRIQRPHCPTKKGIRRKLQPRDAVDGVGCRPQEETKPQQLPEQQYPQKTEHTNDAQLLGAYLWDPRTAYLRSVAFAHAGGQPDTAENPGSVPNSLPSEHEASPAGFAESDSAHAVLQARHHFRYPRERASDVAALNAPTVFGHMSGALVEDRSNDSSNIVEGCRDGYRISRRGWQQNLRPGTGWARKVVSIGYRPSHPASLASASTALTRAQVADRWFELEEGQNEPDEGVFGTSAETFLFFEAFCSGVGVSEGALGPGADGARSGETQAGDLCGRILAAEKRQLDAAAAMRKQRARMRKKAPSGPQAILPSKAKVKAKTKCKARAKKPAWVDLDVKSASKEPRPGPKPRVPSQQRRAPQNSTKEHNSGDNVTVRQRANVDMVKKDRVNTRTVQSQKDFEQWMDTMRPAPSVRQRQNMLALWRDGVLGELVLPRTSVDPNVVAKAPELASRSRALGAAVSTASSQQPRAGLGRRTVHPRAPPFQAPMRVGGKGSLSDPFGGSRTAASVTLRQAAPLQRFAIRAAPTAAEAAHAARQSSFGHTHGNMVNTKGCDGNEASAILSKPPRLSIYQNYADAAPAAEAELSPEHVVEREPDLGYEPELELEVNPQNEPEAAPVSKMSEHAATPEAAHRRAEDLRLQARKAAQRAEELRREAEDATEAELHWQMELDETVEKSRLDGALDGTDSDTDSEAGSVDEADKLLMQMQQTVREQEFEDMARRDEERDRRREDEAAAVERLQRVSRGFMGRQRASTLRSRSMVVMASAVQALRGASRTRQIEQQKEPKLRPMGGKALSATVAEAPQRQ